MLQKPRSVTTLLIVAALCIGALPGNTASADTGTIVRVDTPVGSFEIELFDDIAPVTVQNFLNYIADGDYNDAFAHRSVPGFVFQGGGYTLQGSTITRVPTDPPIVNEASISNTRGTIAMAQAGTNPDSATSQWFINVVDNDGSGLDNLDTLNGGFTVFGEVRGNGMAVVDALAAIPVFNASGAFGPAFRNMPLYEFAGGGIQAGNLVWTELTVVSARVESVPFLGGMHGLLVVVLLAAALTISAGRRYADRQAGAR